MTDKIQRPALNQMSKAEMQNHIVKLEALREENDRLRDECIKNKALLTQKDAEIEELKKRVEELELSDKCLLESASDWTCSCGALNHVKDIQCQFCLRMQGTK